MKKITENKKILSPFFFLISIVFVVLIVNIIITLIYKREEIFSSYNEYWLKDIIVISSVIFFLTQFGKAYKNFLFESWMFVKEYRFQVILFILLSIILSVVIGHIIVVGWNKFFNEFENNEKAFSIRNIAIAIAAIGTAIFAWWKNVISNKQANAALEDNKLQLQQISAQNRQIDIQQKQIELQLIQNYDKIYSDAVELLKMDNDPVKRKAGVQNLKDLAITSPIHTQKCIDMLCSINDWMSFIVKQNLNFFTDKNFDWLNTRVSLEDLEELFGIKKIESKYDNKQYLIEEISVSQDAIKQIGLVLDYIQDREEFNEKYNISYRYLYSIKLYSLNSEKLSTNNLYFVGADLSQALAQKIHFDHCDFRGVNFAYSQLQDSTFFYSNLKTTNFENAQLNSGGIIFSDSSGSNFTDAKLEYTHLMKSNFIGSDMKHADFEGSIITSCEFQSADLSGAKFYGAGVTKSSFSTAILFDTILDGSQFALGEKPLVLTNGQFKKVSETLEKNEDEFAQWLNNVDSESIRTAAWDTYRRYNENKSKNYAEIFEKIDKPNSEFFNLRNEIILDDKFLVKKQLSLPTYSTATSPIYQDLLNNLIVAIKEERPNWFKEFADTEIIPPF